MSVSDMQCLFQGDGTIYLLMLYVYAIPAYWLLACQQPPFSSDPILSDPIPEIEIDDLSSADLSPPTPEAEKIQWFLSPPNYIPSAKKREPYRVCWAENWRGSWA